MKISKKEFKWKYILGILFSIFLLFITKYYIIIILLPISFIFLIHFNSRRLVLFKYIFSILIFSILFFNNNSINGYVINNLNNKRNEQERISFGGYYNIQFDQNNFQRIVRFKEYVSEYEFYYDTKNNSIDSSLLMIKPGLEYQNFK